MVGRSAAQSLYFKIVFGVLGGLTYALVASVLSFRPESEPKNILTSMVRLPASLPAALPIPVNMSIFSPTVAKGHESAKMETLTISCWDTSATQPLNTSARWVRFVGRSCAAEALKSDAWKVSNQSNGFSATVFDSGPKQLTTDYIPLAVGKNEIHFTVTDAGGALREVALHVERQ